MLSRLNASNKYLMTRRLQSFNSKRKTTKKRWVSNVCVLLSIVLSTTVAVHFLMSFHHVWDLISLSLSRFGPTEGRHGRNRRALCTQVKTGEWSEWVCIYVCKCCAVSMLCEALWCYCDVISSAISFLFLSVDLDPWKVGMGGIEGASAHRWVEWVEWVCVRICV